MAIISELAEALLSLSNVSKFVVVSLMVWLCWRLYRFTILPVLYPSAPLEYPYLIPFIGHAFAFFNSSGKLMERAARYFGETRDPFILILGGEVLCIITSPQSAAEVYKNTATVALEAFVKQMYLDIGLSEASVQNMWTMPERTDTTPRKLPHAMIQVFHHQQLNPARPHLQAVTSRLMDNYIRPLEFNLFRNHPALIKDEGESLQISLWELCTRNIISGTSNAYVGDHLAKILPDIVSASLDWEDRSWKFIYGLPAFLSGDMIAARQKLEDGYTKYFETPPEQRADAAFFVKSFEHELRTVGLSNRELAKVFLLHHWALVGNIYKQGFWIISRILFDENLRVRIKNELFRHGKHNINPSFLLNDCPLLDSVYSEVLRTVTAGALLREVTSPTVIGSKTLTERQRIVIPWRQLHINENTWGSDAKVFDPERFLNDKSLAHSLSFKPFGAGATLCPGRHIVRQAIFTFVATLLVKFDVSLAVTERPQKYPTMDEVKPGIGAMPPIRGEDLIVSFKHLQTSEINI